MVYLFVKVPVVAKQKSENRLKNLAWGFAISTFALEHAHLKKNTNHCVNKKYIRERFASYKACILKIRIVIRKKLFNKQSSTLYLNTHLVGVKLAWHPLAAPMTYLELSSETETSESAPVRRNEFRCFRESANRSTS